MAQPARRTASTTSLSQYARIPNNEEDLANRSLDFCNAFWGLADGGYDVLTTRIRGAARTTEELRAFWKERAAIEDDYAKRMAKLAKQPLGRDELGELRNAIDTLRSETDRQAASHSNLAQLMRKELEGPIVELLSKHAQFKKLCQAPVEKSFKAKQTQESYVKKARQKYEDDCVRINSYTAQSTLVQGKDLEKVQLKLEKAKQTVQTNEREFGQFALALADTTSRWEKEWKVFCDSCQDFEEERIECIKDNLWGYANAVSTVCVSDDESCEKLRVSLEQVETPKDVENFVRDYNTGSQIPDPPAFVDYNTLQAGQQPSRPSWRPANFARSSNRIVLAPRQPPVEEEITSGNAGIGAGGGRSDSSRPSSAAANKTVPGANGSSLNGPSPPAHNGQQGSSAATVRNNPTSSQQVPSKPPTVYTSGTQSGLPPSNMPPAHPGITKRSSSTFRAPRAQEPHVEPIDPRAEPMLKVGNKAYPVDPDDDPQGERVVPVAPNVGEQDDPLARQVAALRGASNGSVRRGSDRSNNNPIRRSTNDPPQTSGVGASSPAHTASGSIASAKNYQAQAESVIGGPPPPVARAASPNPPTASFMIPPGNRSTSPIPVEDVVSKYHQHFPGEQASLSISRPNSVNRGRDSGVQSSGSFTRPISPAREGHPGIGAHGGSRSPSPQPMSRSALPQSTYHAPPAQQAPPRATTPLGIAIDETGKVAQDLLADRYSQQQQQNRISLHGGHSLQQGPPYQPPYNSFPVSGPQGQQQYQPHPQPSHQPPSQPHQVPGRTPTSQFYNPQAPQGPQRQGTAGSLYNPYPSQGQPRQTSASIPVHSQYTPQQPPPPPPQSGFGYPEQPQHQPQSYSAYTQPHVQQQPPNGYSHNSRPGDYGVPQAYGQQPPQQPSQGSQNYRAPSPALLHRSPSPAAPLHPPTGQYTDEGEGVLFYVKALYDYQATIDEEFDFQAGDVIAVTATPEDGWWSGMLLDEMRRIPGKTIFPSNFVSLF
ncbi:hypothetical protein K439DRAFT_1613201 [Ramaria rubella]|nr:hypothetical protein K439DRAFT_1613201 [Ramaria rubella]